MEKFYVLTWSIFAGPVKIKEKARMTSIDQYTCITKICTINLQKTDTYQVLAIVSLDVNIYLKY